MKRYFRRVMSSALTVGMLFSSSCIMAHAEETPANPVYNAETDAATWDYDIMVDFRKKINRRLSYT